MKTFVTKTDWLTNNNTSSTTASSSSINSNSKNEIDTIGINKHEIDFDKNYIDLKKYKLDDALINEKFNKSKILYLKDEINLCKYPKCKLKSIDDYEYCYQHIDLVNKKRKLCKWIDKNTNEICDQPAFDLKNGSTSDSNCEYNGLCINHLALKKINKLRKYDKYILIKDFDENEDDQQTACSTSSISNIIDSSPKNDLNEMRFLRGDTQQGETKRTNRKNLMKQMKATNNKDIFKSKKKVRYDSQQELNQDEEDDDEDDYYNEIKSDLIYKDKLDLDNDLDLLDSSDSLDQTIYNLIKSANPKLLTNSNNKNQENGNSLHELENNQTNELQDQTDNDNKSTIKFDYDSALSKTGIYTREEVVKIFKCKLSKLQLLYKKQLAILNDKLIYDRKKYLIMRKNEVEPIIINNNNNSEKNNSSLNLDDIKILKASKKYQAVNKKENYLKQKYDPKYFSSKNSIYNTESLSKCNFIPQDSTKSKCPNQTLPLSKYCKEHILSDSHQILFGECGYDRCGKAIDETNKLENSSSDRCKFPIIASIQPRCPIHLSNVVGLLTTNELTEMNKLNTDKLNYDKNEILNLPDHLTKLANIYKEDYIKKQKENKCNNLDDVNNQAPNLNSLIRIKEELVEDSNCILINEKMNMHNEDDYSNLSGLSIKKEQSDEQPQRRTTNDEINMNDNSTNRSLSPPSSSIISASTSNQANNLPNKSISTSGSSSESSSSETSSTSETSTSSSSETDTSDESDEDDTSTTDSDDDSDTSTSSSSSTDENDSHKNEEEEIVKENDLNIEENNQETIENDANKSNDNTSNNNND